MTQLDRLLHEGEISRQWMRFMQGMDAVFESNSLGLDPADCFQESLTDEFVAYSANGRATPKGIEAYTEMVKAGAAAHFEHWKHVSSNEHITIIDDTHAILFAYVAAHHLHKAKVEGEEPIYQFYTSTAKASFIRTESGWKMDRLDRSRDDWGLG